MYTEFWWGKPPGHGHARTILKWI